MGINCIYYSPMLFIFIEVRANNLIYSILVVLIITVMHVKKTIACVCSLSLKKIQFDNLYGEDFSQVL